MLKASVTSFNLVKGVYTLIKAVSPSIFVWAMTNHNTYFLITFGLIVLVFGSLGLDFTPNQDKIGGERGGSDEE